MLHYCNLLIYWMTRSRNRHEMVTSKLRFIVEVGLGDIVLIYLVINEIDKMILRRDVV